MEEYEIAWRDPFTYKEIKDTEGKVFDEEIYAIAWLPPKRKHKTLYIGITYRQYIRERLAGHVTDYRIYDNRGGKSIFYFPGHLLLGKEQKRSLPRLLRVEAAIIFFHYTFEEICKDNIQYTRTMIDNDLKIRNTGNVPPGIVDFYVDGDDWGRL